MDANNEILKISLKIKDIRQKKNISIQELAYKCDIERSNLSRIESGRNNLTIKTLCIICDALEIPLIRLFEDI